MDETEGKAPDETPEGEAGETPAGEDPAEGEEPTETSGPSGESADAAEEPPGTEPQPPAESAGASSAAPPPQPPMRPTITMTQPARSSSRWVWWVVIAVVAILVIAAAAVFFLTRDGEEAAPAASPSPVEWTGAWGRMDGVGGGLLIAGGAGAYDVTLYDGALRAGETVPATQSEDGRELQFTLPAQFAFGGAPAGPFDATLTLGDSPDTATLRITDANQTSVLMPLRRVAELVPTNGEESPSPSAPAPAVESPAVESPAAP